MLYIIGNNIKYSGYLRNILVGLEDTNSILEYKKKTKSNDSLIVDCKDNIHIPSDVIVKTKYYDAKISVLNATIDEYLSFNIDEKKKPNAILLFFDGDYNANKYDELFKKLGKDFGKTDENNISDDYYSDYQSNDNITRVCCLIKDKNNANNIEMSKLLNVCNEFSFELIVISEIKDVCPKNTNDSESEIIEYSPLNGIIRTIEALHCTIWDTIHRKNTHNSESNIGQSNIDIENSFNQFDLINSMMSNLSSEIKHLNDQERRGKASKIMFDIIKHLNIDFDE
ncbi:hypothetical protein FG379_002772 [Cryptosporidium bovis]|uniref:uncharacterized protein n=1 Tax=Cryptosporidium bovis TaxID=310047 RepID=UPI00351A0003|nr:hypothetical protein FG379_002772 [Cryptosporidium bovis]